MSNETKRGSDKVDARDAIKSQFMKEYVRKDFSDITVKALCAATPVARTTFYSYYDNMDDVLCEIEDEILKGLEDLTETISAGNLPAMDFALYMDAIEGYIREKWSTLYALLVVQPDLRLIRKWKDAIKLNLRKRYPGKQNTGNYDGVAEIAASSIISGYTYWMEHPDTVSTGEIKPILNKVLDTLIQAV